MFLEPAGSSTRALRRYHSTGGLGIPATLSTVIKMNPGSMIETMMWETVQGNPPTLDSQRAIFTPCHPEGLSGILPRLAAGFRRASALLSSTQGHRRSNGWGPTDAPGTHVEREHLAILDSDHLAMARGGRWVPLENCRDQGALTAARKARRPVTIS